MNGWIQTPHRACLQVDTYRWGGRYSPVQVLVEQYDSEWSVGIDTYRVWTWGLGFCPPPAPHKASGSSLELIFPASTRLLPGFGCSSYRRGCQCSNFVARNLDFPGASLLSGPFWSIFEAYLNFLEFQELHGRMRNAFLSLWNFRRVFMLQ